MGDFYIGAYVEKKSGSSWRGFIVGSYSTDLTPIGWAVESETEKGSVQIYPEKALRPATRPTERDAEGWLPIESAPHACHVLATRFDHDAGEWHVAVVASPPSYPFTHFMMLPAPPLPTSAQDSAEGVS